MALADLLQEAAYEAARSPRGEGTGVKRCDVKPRLVDVVARALASYAWKGRIRMSRSSRRNKAEANLAQLESEFVRRLKLALQDCASGRWGLFGQNDPVRSLRSPAPKLIALGEEIRGLRAQLGFHETFAPYERFICVRSLRGANANGEPTLANALLRELEVLGFDEERGSQALQRQAGLAAVAEWEKQHGHLSAEEMDDSSPQRARATANGPASGVSSVACERCRSHRAG